MSPASHAPWRGALRARYNARMSRPRLRTFTLWTGTLLSLLIAAAFVVSAWWQLGFQFPTSRGPSMLLVSGSFMFVTDKMLSAPVSADAHVWGLTQWNMWGLDRASTITFISFPLYALFTAVAVPTLLVWRFVPKFPRGHCRRCGYNLTGLTEARCPECGETFEPGSRAE